MAPKTLKKRKIVHFTIEDLSSGLFRNQVLETVVELSKQDPSFSFEIVVINRFWHIRSHIQSLRTFKADSTFNDIIIKYIPLLPPLRNALKSVLISKIIVFLLSLYARLFLKRRVYLLHCRSYWTTIAALNAGFKNVLFDMRSLLPAESISTGELSAGSRAHSYWLSIEEKCLKGAKISTGVSQAMVEYALNIAPESKVVLVPISFKSSNFRFDPAARFFRRDKFGWKEDDIILVYSGSLGQSGINIDALFSMIFEIMSSCHKTKILFLTMESSAQVKALLMKYAIGRDRFLIVHPNFNEMYAWLSSADIGIHALPKQEDWRTRLGTKVVEYWGNGLPVIVNEYVGSAAEIVEKHGVGSIFLNNYSFKKKLPQVISLLVKKKRETQSDFAKANFSSEVIAQKYLECYRNLVKD